MDDPKELAKLYAAKKAEEEADQAAEKAARAAEAKARETAGIEATNSLNKMVVPYFNELKAAMGDDFTFDVIREAKSHQTLGVKFQVGERPPVSIKSVGGGIVQVQIHKGGGLPYSQIRNAADLSKQKLGELIQAMIEG
jgi:hypothetical protein